jgi:hypothetical protein
MRRLPVIAAVPAIVAAGWFVPAQAAPPASFTKTVTFVDSTPDPTAFFLGPEHCMGRLPAEQPVEVKIPASGVVDVAISGFTGEWSLMITDPKGRVLTTADADAPETESTTFRMRRAGTINILPCNIAGTFEAQLTYGYTYKK